MGSKSRAAKARRLAMRQKVFDRCGWRCVYCGDHVSQENATLDHVVPKAQGGSRSHKNLVLACGECNQRKAAMSVQEFYDLVGFDPDRFYAGRAIVRAREYRKGGIRQ